MNLEKRIEFLKTRVIHKTEEIRKNCSKIEIYKRDIKIFKNIQKYQIEIREQCMQDLRELEFEYYLRCGKFPE